MKRKLIKQGGGGGLTFYVPKKWVDKKGLKPGDEIDLSELDDNLVISVSGLKKKDRSIELTITHDKESIVRTLIVNAYRAGFDRLVVKFSGDGKKVNAVVDRFLIGFEITKVSDGLYHIESVSEPSYENFEKIIHRQFFLVEDILKNIFSQDVSEQVFKVQKYDNFLKRCISKGAFSHRSVSILWQFLSSMTHTARIAYWINQEKINSKTKEDKEMIDLSRSLVLMFDLLKKAYFKQDISFAADMHHLADKTSAKGKKYLESSKNKFIISQMLNLIQLIYISNSNLTGLIELTSLDSSGKY